jgi:hypothetical protein
MLVFGVDSLKMSVALSSVAPPVTELVYRSNRALSNRIF